MKRAVVIVIDSMGIGAMPDCREYNDIPECNTIKNIAEKKEDGLNIPNMQILGIGNLCDIKGVKNIENPVGQYGIMTELSKGKDTTTGHWEMAGLVLDVPFRVYPEGFPEDVIAQFIEKSGCKGILGNYPASGTKIITDLNEEHQKTKYPIVYTSADSVFQIAADTDLIPLETLYKWCEAARSILNGEHNVSRVIARPYKVIDGKPTRISKDRRDYSVVPPKPTVLNEIVEKGGRVTGIGKIEDIFVKSGVTHALHTGSNAEGLDLTLQAVQNELNLEGIKVADCSDEPEFELIFTNLVDTDMLYGHRNDYAGYARAVEEIDAFLPKIMWAMTPEDMLIVTADHGCDPTVPGTDHTRERVPLLIYGKNINPKPLGEIKGFTYVADRIREWLF